MATTEVTVGLHVADHGLDCRTTSGSRSMVPKTPRF
jgi:hypothetical protein